MGATYSTERASTLLSEVEEPSLTPRVWSHSWHESADFPLPPEDFPLSPAGFKAVEKTRWEKLSTSPEFLLPSTLIKLASSEEVHRDRSHWQTSCEQAVRDTLDPQSSTFTELALREDVRCDKSQWIDARQALFDEECYERLGPQNSKRTELVRCDKSQRNDAKQTLCEEGFCDTMGPESSMFNEMAFFEDVRCDKSQRIDDRQALVEEELCDRLSPQNTTCTELVRCDKSQRSDAGQTLREERLCDMLGPQNLTFVEAPSPEDVRCDKSQRIDDKQDVFEEEFCNISSSQNDAKRFVPEAWPCMSSLRNDEENLYASAASQLKSASRPPLRFPTIDIQEAQKYSPFLGSGNQHLLSLRTATPSTCDESASCLNMTPRDGFSGIAHLDDSDDSQSSCSDSQFDDDEYDDTPISNLHFSLNDSSDEEDIGGDLEEQYTFDLGALAAALDAGTSTAELEQHVRAILLSARGRPQDACHAMLSARGQANEVGGALLSARGKAQYSARGTPRQVNGALLSARGGSQEVRGALLSSRGQSKKVNVAVPSAQAKPQDDGGLLSARGKSKHAKLIDPVLMKCIFTPRFVRKSFGGEPEAAQNLDKAVQQTVAAAWKYRRSLTNAQATAQSTRTQSRKRSIAEAPDVSEVPMAQQGIEEVDDTRCVALPLSKPLR